MTKTITVVCDPNEGKIYGSIEEAKENYYFRYDEICDISHEYACRNLEHDFSFEDLVTAIIAGDRSVFGRVMDNYYEYVDEQEEENFRDWLRCDCIVENIEVEV